MINIILDKSAFQSLGYLELLKLNDYFTHNITPIITQEILGDLKKESREGKSPSKDRVIDFAKKLFPHQAVINSHFEQVIKSELLGKPIEMDGRPFLDVEKIVQTDDQRKGFVIAESQQEKSIQKWKVGLFEEADFELSELWRAITTQKDRLEKVKNSLPKVNKGEKIKSFENLTAFVENVLNTYESQDQLLKDILTLYNIRPLEAISCFKNWFSCGRPKLIEFIPYTLYCLKVDLMFNIGLQHDLINTRPTNKLDLEYLYYIPFCDVFSSGDKFHRNIVPFLLSERQKFIESTELKKDLSMIIDYLDKLDENVRKKFYKEPPLIDESLTFQLWNEYFDYPKGRPINRNMSDEQLARMKKEMDELIAASKSGTIQFNVDDKPEFIVKERFLGRNDPCYCGSTKPIVGCCISEEQWRDIIEKQKNIKK